MWIIFGLVVSHVVMFVFGWWLCSKTTQAYIRQEIMGGRTPFHGDELEQLKQFVHYDERK